MIVIGLIILIAIALLFISFYVIDHGFISRSETMLPFLEKV